MCNTGSLVYIIDKLFSTSIEVNNCIFWKKKTIITSLHTLFLVKEEANSYKLGIILFAQARGSWKSLFGYNASKKFYGMAVNSCNVEAVIRDQCFFMDFNSACGNAGESKE